jgi:hypothetical protein
VPQQREWRTMETKCRRVAMVQRETSIPGNSCSLRARYASWSSRCFLFGWYSDGCSEVESISYRCERCLHVIDALLRRRSATTSMWIKCLIFMKGCTVLANACPRRYNASVVKLDEVRVSHPANSQSKNAPLPSLFPYLAGGDGLYAGLKASGLMRK